MYDDFDILKLEIKDQDFWDERNEKFVIVKGETLLLKHTLTSLNKYESIHEKPLMIKRRRTREDKIGYLKCMLLEDVKDEKIFDAITNSDLKKVDEYINKGMTATTFSDLKERNVNGGFVTAELIYYWMTAFNIPFDPCQDWHLNKLLTLVKVCSEKQKPPKKKPRKESMNEILRLNEERKKALGTTG